MTIFTLPTSRVVTQDWAQEFYNFNGTPYPNGFYHSLGWKGHNGIDYGCFTGDPVEAVCAGVIEYVGPGNNHPLLTGGGNAILLRNDELGIRFEYLHLSQQNVHTGQRVSVGQVIGLSGATGAVTAPHLHLGAIPVGSVNQADGWRGRVDPTPYLYGNLNPDYAGSTPQGNITKEEDIMASLDDLRTVIREEVAKTPKAWFKNKYGTDVQFESLLGAIDLNANNNNANAQAKLDRIIGEVVGLRAAVSALAAGSNVTPEQVERSIKEALAGFSITLTAGDK